VFVDHTRIEVVAGNGGRGSVSFRREKFVPKGGPDGGDGGRGGSVWLEVDPHVRTLLDCRETRRYRAPSGRAGSGNNKSGAYGDDLVIRLPAGTVVKDAESGETLADLVKAGDRWRAARGGKGGRGNARFATPTHQAPRRADPGERGEERWLELELKLIADVGLVGLPNAGKSTLLSRVTRARPRIAPYPFTTLEPNLGIVRLDEERSFVMADLPGLIEGAHQGKGLGLQFLRHLERTHLLALLVDVSSPSPEEDARIVLNELASHSPELAAKPLIAVLTKADLLPAEDHAQAPAQAGMPDAPLVSAHTGLGLRELMEACWARLPVPVEDGEPEGAALPAADAPAAAQDSEEGAHDG
jgi:GTP-binding protein